jgi:hypothetical protein
MGQLFNNRDGSINGKFVSKIINRTRAGVPPISAEDKARLAEYEKWKRGEPNTEEQRWVKPPKMAKASEDK